MACELFPLTQLQMNHSNVNVCGTIEVPEVQAGKYMVSMSSSTKYFEPCMVTFNLENLLRNNESTITAGPFIKQYFLVELIGGGGIFD